MSSTKSHSQQLSAQKRRHRLLLTLHRIIGLKLSVFVTFVLFTGTLAVFSDELDWLLNSKVRVIAQDKPHLTLGELTDIAARAHPHLVIRRAEVPKSAWHAAAFLVQKDAGEFGWLFVNPYNGEMHGLSMYLNMRRFLREIHRNLMLPTFIGIPIVSIAALLLLVSLVTGILVYKNFWRYFFKLPSTKNLAAFWSGLHRLLGVWSIWFIVLVVLTSFWYLFESLGGRAPGYRHVFNSALQQQQPQTFAELQIKAQEAAPNLQITQIIPANNPQRPVLFYGKTSQLLVRDRANFVALHAQTGQILEQANTLELSVHQRISEMADPLHFGNFAGLTSRLIWFVFGLCLTLLSLSAVKLYAVRVKRDFEQDAGFWLRLKVGMGKWFWVSVALILTAFIAWPFREY